MSAACGFPSARFDLFLESNVMIVADFEIWKRTCCASLQSSFACLATLSCSLFEIPDSSDEKL